MLILIILCNLIFEKVVFNEQFFTLRINVYFYIFELKIGRISYNLKLDFYF